MSDKLRLIGLGKSLALNRFPQEQREKVKDILDGKEVIIEHSVRHGKIICHFIPTPSDEIIKKDLRRQIGGEPPIVIYQCGTATREAHEQKVIKKMKAGTPADELIGDFLEREQIEGTTFFEPIANLAKSYFFSEELKIALPNFLNYLVEKLDINEHCLQLDEYQTLDFVPPETSERAMEIKKILAEDFLAKHSNEQEIKNVLRVKPGGARKRRGFVWTNIMKTAFYEKVESVPKKKNKSYWQDILNILIDQEFDAETITWIKSRPTFKEIPRKLFDDAIKTWRKYLERENWDKMKPQDKPRAFEYRHALHLLGYPDLFAYSTLETYYYEGKKLSDNQK